MYNGNRLKLGLFGFNCEGGMAITTAPENWSPTWENNIAGRAEGGRRRGSSSCCRSAAGAATAASRTSRGSRSRRSRGPAACSPTRTSCTVFGTIHAPMIHPIVAAKQMATVDLLSEGRFGLNLVCGWNQDEFDMFGKEQLEHDERYEYGQEWLDVVRTIWREEEPVTSTAASSSSPADRPAEAVRRVGAGAHERRLLAGRARIRDAQLRVPAHVAHRRRERPARRRRGAGGRTARPRPGHRPVGDRLRRLPADARRGGGVPPTTTRSSTPTGRPPTTSWSSPACTRSSSRPSTTSSSAQRFAGGHGMYPIIGDPDHVADELERIAAAGFAALAFSFIDYVGELDLFRDEVLPRLEAPRAARDGSLC